MPGKTYAHQRIFRFWRKSADFFIHLPSEKTQIMICQQEDILPALPQRRRRQGNDVEPIVEILAKSTLTNLLLDINIGGGDNSNIYLDVVDSTNPAEGQIPR